MYTIVRVLRDLSINFEKSTLSTRTACYSHKKKRIFHRTRCTYVLHVSWRDMEKLVLASIYRRSFQKINYFEKVSGMLIYIFGHWRLLENNVRIHHIWRLWFAFESLSFRLGICSASVIFYGRRLKSFHTSFSCIYIMFS